MTLKVSLYGHMELLLEHSANDRIVVELNTKKITIMIDKY
jgi:hypothetical protein